MGLCSPRGLWKLAPSSFSLCSLAPDVSCLCSCHDVLPHPGPSQGAHLVMDWNFQSCEPNIPFSFYINDLRCFLI